MNNNLLFLVILISIFGISINIRKSIRHREELVRLDKQRIAELETNYARVFSEYKKLKIVHESLEQEYWNASQEISKIRAAYESTYYKLSCLETEENYRGHY